MICYAAFKKESLQRMLSNVTASFRKTKKTLSNVTFFKIYFLLFVLI